MFGLLISPTVVHAMVGIARCEEATHRAVVEVQRDCQWQAGGRAPSGGSGRGGGAPPAMAAETEALYLEMDIPLGFQ